MRVLGLLLILSLLLVSAVSADNFKVELTPESQNIKINETAMFDLVVENTLQVQDIFEIYSPDVVWDISTEPSADRNLLVLPGQRKKTTLKIRPLYVNPGLYTVNLNVRRAGTAEVIKKQIQLGISDLDRPETYSPSIYSEVKVEEEIDPRDPIVIRVLIKNQNRRNLERVDLKLRGDLINKDYETSLKPLESKELTFTAKLDPLTPPQVDTLKLTIFAYANGQPVQFDEPGATIQIEPYGKIEQTVSHSKGFLTRTQTFRFENTGNTPRDKTFDQPSGLLSSIFIDAKPEATIIKENGIRKLSWHVVVESTEVQEIIVTTNYRILFYFLIFLLVLLFIYYMARSPVTVKKAAMVVGSKEGGISELKIIINLRNRGNAPVRELRIADKVPAIADVHRDFEVGTLKPDRVARHQNGETFLKWEMEQLDAKEERILSYKIHTKLHVLGGLKLAPAQVKYKYYNYVRTIYSNMENLFQRR